MACPVPSSEEAAAGQLVLHFDPYPVADRLSQEGRSPSRRVYDNSTFGPFHTPHVGPAGLDKAPSGSESLVERLHSAWFPDADRFLASRDEPASAMSDAARAAQVSGFRPNAVPEAVWGKIGPFVRDTVTAAGAKTPYTTTQMLTVVTRLARWSWELGIPLTPTDVLPRQQVDRFIEQGCGDLDGASRGTYQSVLRRVGEVVVGPPLCPLPSTPVTRNGSRAPYSHDEVGDLLGWAMGLRSPRRHNVLAALACGVGAGLAAKDLDGIIGTDVHRTERGTVIVVTGDDARLVWVRPEWEDTLADLAALVGSRPLFQPGRTRLLGKKVPDYFEDLPTGRGVPKFSLQRCRTTWIVRHLAAGVPVNVLADAAGITPARVGSYGQFLDPVDDDRVRVLMCGPS